MLTKYLLFSIIILSNPVLALNSFVNELKNDEIQEIIIEKPKAIFETESCIKYNKNNETFWKNHETDTFKVVDIGSKYLKTLRIIYMKEDTSSWLYGDDIFLVEFSAQKKFMKTICPDIESKIDPSVISKKK